MANPFLKSPGGKRQLIRELSARVPAQFNTYHERFVGGGALFFWLQAQGRITRAVLSDVNERIARTYRAVRDDVESVIVGVQRMQTDRDSFYSVRAQDPNGGTDVDVACWYIYILRCCYNGLYRENRQGRCNSPYGTPKVDIVDPVALRDSSRALQGVDIRHEDFAEIDAAPGDFVYFDPPYWPQNNTTAKFTSYTAKGFGPEQHAKLRNVAEELKWSGVHVLLSNSDTAMTRALYAGFDIAAVGARRAINCRAERRGRVSELLIR